MDWIKLPVRIRDDPRIYVLAEKLSCSFEEALGRVVRLMTWCGDHETRLLPASLDGVTRNALRDAGLIGPEGLSDFEFTSSSLATSRESNRLRQEKHRRKLKQIKGVVTVTSLERRALGNGLDLDLEGEVDLEPERDLEPKAKPLGASAPVEVVDRYPKRFSTWWKNYPRKVGKDAALVAWKKAAKVAGGEDELYDLCKAALPWQRASEDWNRDGCKFIPHPATYLNQGRYRDEEPK